MNDLDRQFWLIILTSWDMSEIDNLAGYARDCESSVSWAEGGTDNV